MQIENGSMSQVVSTMSALGVNDPMQLTHRYIAASLLVGLLGMGHVVTAQGEDAVVAKVEATKCEVEFARGRGDRERHGTADSFSAKGLDPRARKTRPRVEVGKHDSDLGRAWHSRLPKAIQRRDSRAAGYDAAGRITSSVPSGPFPAF